MDTEETPTTTSDVDHFESDDDFFNYFSEEDYEIPEFRSIKEYMIIEERVENLFWEIKQYTDEKFLPLCEKLTMYDLIDFLYPDIKLEY